MSWVGANQISILLIVLKFKVERRIFFLRRQKLKFNPYNKPTEPRKPQEPSRTKCGETRQDIYSGQSLILEAGTYRFETERSFCDELDFYLISECEVPNENYETELAEHKQKMVQYEIDLTKYKKELKEWKAQKKIWDAQQKEKDLAQKRKLLEKLKKELGET